MPQKIKDISNQKFGYITAISPTNDRRNGNVIWKCICSCGNSVLIVCYDLVGGKTKSCGCLNTQRRKERLSKIKIGKTHGFSYTKTYKTWDAMIRRCSNSNAWNYKYYGGKGIKVCGRWLESFENFYEDMGERPNNKTIDRINNDGNYESNNCRWATVKEQMENRH